MEQSTADLTVQYINEHPFIKSCLKKGLLNYSALARHISQELDITKKTSQEAILVAARRFQEKLQKQHEQSHRINEILQGSEIEIKNKMHVFIIQKRLNFEAFDTAQKKIRKEHGKSYFVEGSDFYTMVTQQKYIESLKQTFPASALIRHHENVVMVILKSSDLIEDELGVTAYLTALFAENGVNILELVSSWKDTLFLIDAKDVNKVLTFLDF